MQEIKQLLLFACFDNNNKRFIVFLKRGSSGEEVVTTYLNEREGDLCLRSCPCSCFASALVFGLAFAGSELCVYRDSPNYV